MSVTLFTPYSGLLGGILIGLAAVVLMAGNGRIMGASGIFNNLLTTKYDDNFMWRAIFVVGLLIGTAAIKPFAANAKDIAFQSSPELIMFGGLLVGLGTAWGAGCTSGHGICGISRFSLRSLVATIIFMAVAVATVMISRHVLGLSS